MLKTIYDSGVRDDLVIRIKEVSKDHKALWGKMNVFQMVKHNTYWNEWILGTNSESYHHEFIGKIFGKMGLRRMIRDDKPFDKNVPTSAQFKIKEQECDLESEKEKWISLIHAYENFDNPDFIHDFFGKMTDEQIGILVYKHTDHHLRQFGC